MKLEKKILLFNVSRGTVYFEGRVKSILATEIFKRKCHVSANDEVLDDCGDVLMDADDFAKAEETGIGRLAFDGDVNTWYTSSADNLSSAEITAILKDL